MSKQNHIQHKAQIEGAHSPRPTLRHRMALENITENRGMSVYRALIDVGYSTHTAKKPKQVLTSKGFRALLHEKGLTEELVASSLVQDIKEKPRRRVQELQLAADILKMRGNNTPHADFKPTKIVVRQMNVMVDNTGGSAHTPPHPSPVPVRESTPA